MRPLVERFCTQGHAYRVFVGPEWWLSGFADGWADGGLGAGAPTLTAVGVDGSGLRSGTHRPGRRVERGDGQRSAGRPQQLELVVGEPAELARHHFLELHAADGNAFEPQHLVTNAGHGA